MSSHELAQSYDDSYRQSNYFKYRLWLYRPFVRALVRRVGLKPGDSLLDAGCGQGFFTSLFADYGISAIGIDVSAAGVAAAREAYLSPRVTFEVGDVLELEWRNEFDCVFSRSCSLYNSTDFETKREVTDRLLAYVRPGGVLIFDYYSNLGAKEVSQQWIYHSLKNVQEHFSSYSGSEVYFSLRIDTMILGRLSLSRPASRICALLSRGLGIGGELVALVRKNN
jgi:SAM-dependent methyltransferase